jgi:predicted DNA-binding ribbon-helix-helix protein
MRSSIVKRRPIIIDGRRTNVSLEDLFWELLKEIAQTQGQTLSDLVDKIGEDRQDANLSSAIRLFVLGYVRDEIARYNVVAPHKKDGVRHPGLTHA